MHTYYSVDSYPMQFQWRGCRQGDPIAPYLFLLVAEILSLLIEKNSDIKGIQVDKND